MTSVSVVIPCFNDGRYLSEAVGSARAQSHPDVEIVVVNDGSTDPQTLRVLDQVSDDGAHVVHQENKGLPAARNAGISASSGDYILPLDSDDRISPSYAAQASAVLDRDPDVGIVGGMIEYFGMRSGTDRPSYDGIERMLFQNCLFTSSMTRRSDWEAVGGYPTEISLGEDWVYWLRILALGRSVEILPETVWFYRQHDRQMTRNLDVGDWTRAVLFAMRDQPQLYATHIDEVIDYMEPKLRMLDSYRRRYGKLADLSAALRERTRAVRRRP